MREEIRRQLGNLSFLRVLDAMRRAAPSVPENSELRTIATTASWLSIVHPHRPPQTANANIVKECP